MTEELENILRDLAQHVEEATIHNEGWDYHLEWRDRSIVITETRRYVLG